MNSNKLDSLVDDAEFALCKLLVNFNKNFESIFEIRSRFSNRDSTKQLDWTKNNKLFQVHLSGAWLEIVVPRGDKNWQISIRLLSLYKGASTA